MGCSNELPGVVTQAPPAGVHGPPENVKSLSQAQLVRLTETDSSTRSVPARVMWSPNSPVEVAWKPKLEYDGGSVAGMES